MCVSSLWTRLGNIFCDVDIPMTGWSGQTTAEPLLDDCNTTQGDFECRPGWCKQAEKANWLFWNKSNCKDCQSMASYIKDRLREMMVYRPSCCFDWKQRCTSLMLPTALFLLLGLMNSVQLSRTILKYSIWHFISFCTLLNFRIWFGKKQVHLAIFMKMIITGFLLWCKQTVHTAYFFF